MFKPEKLQELIEKNKTIKKEMCADIGVSGQWLINVLNGSEPGASKLEKVANYFQVSLDYFFDRENNEHDEFKNPNQLDNCQLEIKYLKSVVQEKERTIQLLMSKLKDSSNKL